ncbi:MAG: hypothetical protein LIP03_12075 [Bacteroidales bacterium]|nr:hypothetical protein [Bacteroidales bacterium]
MLKIFTLLLICCIAAAPAGATERRTINSNWSFSQPLRDGQWERVELPHTWNAHDATDDERGFYRGIGIYKHSVDIPVSAQGKTLRLHFEGANQVASVKVNGISAGSHTGGYTEFCIDITPYVIFGAPNDIEVTVDNSHDPMIPPLSADFTFFGGIYRDVFLEIEEPVHLSHADCASSGVYISTPSVTTDKAEARVTTLIDNAAEKATQVLVKNTIYSPTGETVATLSKKVKLPASAVAVPVDMTFQIANPDLWSPSNPALYTLVIEVCDPRSGKPYASHSEQFGCRWYSFDPDKGFYLNGQPLKLIGTNRHQDYPGLGWALDDAHHLRDVEMIKQMGGNFLRVSHYPQDPTVLRACDRLGILATVEIPIVNAVTEDQQFLDNCLTMQEGMIKQNRNHPSVIAWAYMNEVMLVPPYSGDDERYPAYCAEVNRQAQAIDALTRQLDPERYTLIPCHGNLQAYEDAGLIEVPRLIGWNLYQGWYSGTFPDFDVYLRDFHAKYPGIPTLLTEYGADCDTRIHSTQPQRYDFSMEYADLYHEHYLRSILSMPFLAGANLWNLNEFHSEVREHAKPHFNPKGIVTADRQPKNTYWLYKANLSDEPFVAFANRQWTSRSGQLNADGTLPTEIKIYSNAPSVTLTHNGKQIGHLPVVDGVAKAMVPLADGLNSLIAQSAEASDALNIRLRGIAADLKSAPFDGLWVGMGTDRSVTDPATGECWIPDQEYRPGSWGYVGGSNFALDNWAGVLPASDVDVLGVDLDPLYQTCRKGIESFKADLAPGRYAVTLYWADLSKETYEKLAYNLGGDAIHEESDDCFDVSINGTTVLPALDVRRMVGRQRPLQVTFETMVLPDQSLTIDFAPIHGQASLHAIRILPL